MVTIDPHPPSETLEIIKAVFDVLTVIAFIILLIVVIYSRKRFIMFEKKRIFVPLLIFSILGVISTAMDAFDEFFWFSPKEFYDLFWKPSRLGMLLLGSLLLLYTFYQFFRFEKRLLGEE